MTLGNDKQHNTHTVLAWIITILIMKHVVWICVQHLCSAEFGGAPRGDLRAKVKLTSQFSEF